MKGSLAIPLWTSPIRPISPAKRWLAAVLVIAALSRAAIGGADPAPGKPGTNPSPVHVFLSVIPSPAGAAAELALTLRIDPPWYIYTKSSRSQVMQIALDLPPGLAPEGDWIRPKARTVYLDERVEVYSGEQVLKRTLKVASSLKEKVVVKATIRFQACDPEICRPPEETKATAEFLPGAPAERS